MKNIEYLGHILIKDNYKDDYVCSICSVRLEYHGSNTNTFFLIKNFIDDLSPGEACEIFKLSCKETLIKNLLE